MFRMWLLVFIMSVTALLSGCGGDSGNGVRTLGVSIQSERVVPRTVTSRVGDTVRFTNVDSQPRQVVSGTLISVPNPQTVGPVSIQANNTFLPDALDIGLGDTVIFRNDRGSQITLDVVDDAGIIVSSLVLNPGDLALYSGFPNAGRFTIQQRNNALFAMPVIVRGVPNPNFRFESPVLSTGETFNRQFTAAGTEPYYVTDPTNPSRPFITGNVTVQ